MDQLETFLPANPLHLLDDFLATLPTGFPTVTPNKSKGGDNDPNSSSAEAETEHDLVLRAAGELLENHGSLLESALLLLEDQEKYQSEKKHAGDPNDDSMNPVIRKIRARRSGRVAFLVRKRQRKKASTPERGDNDIEKRQSISEHYYLCLLGCHRSNIHAVIRGDKSGRIYRQGAHCTCRSFFQRIKGDGKTFSRSRNSAAGVEEVEPLPESVACKHLIALILIPHLLPWRKIGVDEEIVDDRVFAKMAMKATF
mmetsp:Transcript_16032/g.33533  ORF Transcript_16032/g.33533 Transcript_16032/m.33533 type:complete len:255 (-) Transcript_16032:144-908(-)